MWQRSQVKSRSAMRAWAPLLTVALVWLAACGQVPTGQRAQATQTAQTQMLTPEACDMAKQWKAPVGNVELDDMAMDAPGDGWAVGAISGGSAPAGVIYHLTQGAWKRLPQTYPGAGLSTISMDSPDDGWAASTSPITGTGFRALVLHYTSGQWRQVDVPALDSALKGRPGTSDNSIMSISVQMFGPDAGWMFAWTNSQRNPNDPASQATVVILRYLGGVWTQIPAPPVKDSTEMFSLSSVSGDEAWIGATDYGTTALTTLFAHYVNGGWSIWPQTFPGVTEFISMTSPTDGWAFDMGDPGDAGLLHYNGAAWAPMATPADWASKRIYLYHVVYTAPNGATWFGGSGGVGGADAVVEQYANGQWSQVAWPYADSLPNSISVDGSGDLWGIGDIAHQKGCPPLMTTYIMQGVFFHMIQGSWSRQVLP